MVYTQAMRGLAIAGLAGVLLAGCSAAGNPQPSTSHTTGLHPDAAVAGWAADTRPGAGTAAYSPPALKPVTGKQTAAAPCAAGQPGCAPTKPGTQTANSAKLPKWSTTASRKEGIVATGTLLDYQLRKKELSCSELHVARLEAQGAVMAVSTEGQSGRGWEVAVFNGLAKQVARQLTKEFDEACLSPHQAKPGFEARSPRG